MDITQFYASTGGGMFLIFVLASCRCYIASCIKHISLLISRHFTRPYVFGRHWVLGRWTRADVLIQVMYITANTFCASFHASSISEAGLRAGTLSLINNIPLLAGLHLGFLADLLGVSITVYRQIHRSAGLMSLLLALFHVIVAMTGGAPIAGMAGQNLFALIGVVSICITTLCFLPLLRDICFEILLRIHQALAVLYVYSAWRHIPSDGLFPRFYLYVSAALFVTTFLLQVVMMLHRNGIFGHKRSQATITNRSGAVGIRLNLARPLMVEPGQYFNLWIPSISFWSFLQSHPFIATSWIDGKQETLDFFVQPRKGFTKKLLHYAQSRAAPRLAVFSGPHGDSVAVSGFENVIMIADGFGIAAHLPYLKKLIQGYHARNVRARRIHLIWQIQDLDLGKAAEPLLNDALYEDFVDNGYILRISLYVESGNVNETTFGRRSTVYTGPVDIKQLILDELESMQKDGKGLPGIGKTIIMISGTVEQRDTLRNFARDQGGMMEIVELEYQPPK